MWHTSNMPKKINYTLSEEELLAIEQAIKNHPDLRVRERARLIRLLHKGHKHPEVAEIMGISVGQVYWWHKRWRQERVEGLADFPRSGRPHAADEGYRARLEELMETDPHELGYGFNVWTSARLMAHMKRETGVVVTERTFLNILARMDFVYRRPKHDLAPLQEKEAKERAEETVDELKKKPKEKRSNFSLWTKQP